MVKKQELTLSEENHEIKPGQNGREFPLELAGLKPAPEEEWERLRVFLGLNDLDLHAMLATVEPLFKRGHELVVGNYEYLLQNHETAAILGWERGPDPEHLAERRRFFTVWLARTLSIDLGHDFARYLFRAGQIHAAHGPRHIHVPEVYVTGAISLVNQTFARFLSEEIPGNAVIPAALAGWNKYLTLHLHMMLQGFQTAQELDRGDFLLPVSLFGKMRTLWGRNKLTIGMPSSGNVNQALHKLFNYYPHTRSETFDVRWEQGDRLDATGIPWMTVSKVYVLRQGWRLLLNGREVCYTGGLEQAIQPGDELQVFPPGR